MTETGSGAVQEKEKLRLSEIIQRLNDLFEGDFTEGDQLSMVATTKSKMMESETLVEQAASNSKEQFAASPDLRNELLNAIMDAGEAHQKLSEQALNSERVRLGLMDILLGPGGLYEALRTKAETARAGNQ